MENIYDHLRMIRERPGMYIGSKKIRDLFIYTLGYRWCLWQHGIKEQEFPNFDSFNDWIAKRYWFNESTSWWANMILSKSDNEEGALEKFFVLLEEFLKKKGKL